MISKSDFIDSTRVTRKLVLCLYECFWTLFLRHVYCMIFLKLVGDRYHTFGGKSMNSI